MVPDSERQIGEPCFMLRNGSSKVKKRDLEEISPKRTVDGFEAGSSQDPSNSTDGEWLGAIQSPKAKKASYSRSRTSTGRAKMRRVAVIDEWHRVLHDLPVA